MTLVKYLMSLGACTTGELLALKREDPKGYTTIVQWTKEQAAANGIVLEESPLK